MPLEDLGFQEVSKSFSLDTLKLAQVTPYRISYDGPDIYFATESEFESKPKSERDPRARREILEKSKTSKPITRNSVVSLRIQTDPRSSVGETKTIPQVGAKNSSIENESAGDCVLKVFPPELEKYFNNEWKILLQTQKIQNLISLKDTFEIELHGKKCRGLCLWPCGKRYSLLYGPKTVFSDMVTVNNVLKALHERKLCHRDVAPKNIIEVREL